MRPTTTLVLAATMFLPVVLRAQDLVGTGPTNRTALLEEFTAMGCGNCPAAHATANTLATAYPQQLVVIGVHGGGLADPVGSQPDFRTTDGAALWDLFNVTYQPRGTVNRRVLQDAPQWAAAVADVLAQPSPVNLGFATTYDADTRMVTVDVEIYYTADRTTDDRISVVLVQDHITAFQQDYVNGPQPTYDHRHVLRDHITTLDGDAVSAAQQMDLVQRAYTYEVPVEWSIADLQVVVFVREADGEVWQVDALPAAGGATAMEDVPSAFLGNAFPVPADEVLFVPLTDRAVGAILELRDVQGRLVQEQRIAPGTTLTWFDVAHLAAGVYTYGCAGGAAKRVVVR